MKISLGNPTACMCIFLAFVIAFGAFPAALTASAQPSLSAKSAILVELESGLVLFEHNARETMGMASTTKIMTALTVLRLSPPDKVLSVSSEAVGTEGSSVYLTAGERLTVEQLLYALLLSSANDAAVALAIGTCGSMEGFADEMNKYAAELGAFNSHFVNPHGLYHEEHYTTAYDLALITMRALADPLLKKIFSTYKTTIPMCGEPDGRLLVNHNKMLTRYDGAIGVKTGFTKKTGRCLVSAARKDGMTLIAVTLSAPDDWRDHTSMLDYGFENYTRRIFADVGEYSYSLPLCGSVSRTVELTNTKPLVLTVPKDRATAIYEVSSSYRFVYSPVRENYTYAYVTLTAAGQSTGSPLTIK